MNIYSVGGGGGDMTMMVMMLMGACLVSCIISVGLYYTGALCSTGIESLCRDTSTTDTAVATTTTTTSEETPVEGSFEDGSTGDANAASRGPCTNMWGNRKQTKECKAYWAEVDKKKNKQTTAPPPTPTTPATTAPPPNVTPSPSDIASCKATVTSDKLFPTTAHYKSGPKNKWTDCCAWCQGTTNCKAWSWNGPTKKTCYLFKTVPTSKTKVTGAYSGVQPVTGDLCANPQSGKIYNTADAFRSSVRSSWQECCKWGNTVKDTKAWSWNPTDKKCSLFKSVPTTGQAMIGGYRGKIN